MQKTSNFRIPFGVKALSEMMGMTESEVRFFPKIDDLKEHIKNYNYNMYTKKVLISNLGILKERCKESNLEAYVEGIDKLINVIQYRY